MDYRLLKTFGLGVGSALVAMAVFPVVAAVARPVAKGFVKGGLNLKDQAKQAYAESKEKVEDIVAEAKEEIDEEKGS